MAEAGSQYEEKQEAREILKALFWVAVGAIVGALGMYLLIPCK